jgi:hypothetical protein
VGATPPALALRARPKVERTPARSSPRPVRQRKAVLDSHREVTNGTESCPRAEPATKASTCWKRRLVQPGPGRPLSRLAASAGPYACCSVATFEYRYELRRGDELVATGHLTHERPLAVGDRLVIGGKAGIVRTVEPLLGECELRLVAQLLREDI